MAEKAELMINFKVDDMDVKLTPSIVQDYIVGKDKGKITLQEFKFFTELCKARKLNPFLKEAYLVKYDDRTPASIVVGKDAILKRALQHPKFDGRDQGIIVVKDSGEIDYRKGTFHLPNEQLVGGWAKVYRKDISHPTEITVSFDEVAQKKSNGELNKNWATKGATMVEKVALVRALRETFVEDLSGMIDRDEEWEPQTLQENTSYTQVVSVENTSDLEELSKEYIKLRTKLNEKGIDFRDEMVELNILEQAGVKTQDLSLLNGDELKRLNDVYKSLLSKEEQR